MSDWIDYGGYAPRLCSNAYERNTSGNRGPVRWKAPLQTGCAVLLLALVSHFGHARDLDGRYAKANPELKAWFDGLRSGKGPCCSDADGTAVSDVDWESKDGHYRVRLGGEWIDLPDDALVTVPNRAGRTMVWPMPMIEGDTIKDPMLYAGQYDLKPNSLKLRSTSRHLGNDCQALTGGFRASV